MEGPKSNHSNYLLPRHKLFVSCPPLLVQQKLDERQEPRCQGSQVPLLEHLPSLFSQHRGSFSRGCGLRATHAWPWPQEEIWYTISGKCTTFGGKAEEMQVRAPWVLEPLIIGRAPDDFLNPSNISCHSGLVLSLNPMSCVSFPKKTDAVKQQMAALYLHEFFLCKSLRLTC
jgi:hypothetical protein